MSPPSLTVSHGILYRDAISSQPGFPEKPPGGWPYGVWERCFPLAVRPQAWQLPSAAANL